MGAPQKLPSAWFVPTEIETRPVELGDGSTHEIHFRHLTGDVFETYARHVSSRDERIASRAGFVLLAAGMCDAEGNPVATADELVNLKRPVFRALFDALLDVNTYTEKARAEAGKPSAGGASSTSGMSSRSRSAGARSRSGKRASAGESS